MALRNVYTWVGICLLSWAVCCPSKALASKLVSINTDQQEYKPGDDIVITIGNYKSEPIFYDGLCSVNHCQLDENEWTCEEVECVAPQEILSSDEKRDFRIKVVGLLSGVLKYKFTYTTAILERHETVYSSEFIVLGKEGSMNYPVDKQAKNFPVSKRSFNPKFMDIRPNDQRLDNQFIAKNFKNQNRPSNQEMIRQRKRQDKRQSYQGSYSLQDNEIILTISGVNPKERYALEYLLVSEFSIIDSIEELHYEKGMIKFFVKLDINSEEFSQILQDAEFPSFRLSLIRFSPNYMDFILKR